MKNTSKIFLDRQSRCKDRTVIGITDFENYFTDYTYLKADEGPA